MSDVSAPPPPPGSMPYPVAPPPYPVAPPPPGSMPYPAGSVPYPVAPYPVLPPVATRPRLPRKWLGPKGGWLVFLGLTFFWLCNVLFDQLVVHHVGLSPNSLVLGGFGMTAALAYTLAYRLRPQDGISVVRLLLAFLLGGLLSTELAILIEAPLVFALGSSPQATLITHSLAGPIEEACKLVAVVIAARGLVVRNARNGLFLGGAVGLGFAAFEDMRYASSALSDNLLGHGQLFSVIEVTFGRDLVGPFEHPVMTALLGAALFAASRNGRFRITGIVVLAYLGVAAAHSLVDTSGDLLAFVIQPALVASEIGAGIGILVALGLSAVWLVYSRRLNRRMLAQEAEPAPLTSGPPAYGFPPPAGDARSPATLAAPISPAAPASSTSPGGPGAPNIPGGQGGPGQGGPGQGGPGKGGPGQAGGAG